MNMIAPNTDSNDGALVSFITVKLPEYELKEEDVKTTKTGVEYKYGEELATQIEEAFDDTELATYIKSTDLSAPNRGRYKYEGDKFVKRLQRELVFKVEASLIGNQRLEAEFVEIVESFHPFIAISILDPSGRSLQDTYSDWVRKDVPEPPPFPAPGS